MTVLARLLLDVIAYGCSTLSLVLLVLLWGDIPWDVRVAFMVSVSAGLLLLVGEVLARWAKRHLGG